MESSTLGRAATLICRASAARRPTGDFKRDVTVREGTEPKAQTPLYGRAMVSLGRTCVSLSVCGPRGSMHGPILRQGAAGVMCQFALQPDTQAESGATRERRSLIGHFMEVREGIKTGRQVFCHRRNAEPALCSSLVWPHIRTLTLELLHC